MTSILELNDADLTLYRDTQVLHRSPGVAVVLDRDVHFGDEALKLSRVPPRQANLQYFTRLNADPLPVPGSRARNHADLVYLHLQTFKPLIDAEGGEVLLAVPGILSGDQLGVLLGVLQEVGIRVGGFVDAAVAALCTQPAHERTYHLDVMMQRAVVTALDVGTEVAKQSAQEVLDCGLNRLLDGWINVIADRFVRETRFDPLHAAATEQQLFNRVYDWVEGGAGNGELVVEIVHAEHTRRVELGRSLLEDKAEQRFRQLADALPRGSRVSMSARAARLPGLRAALAALQIDATALPAEALSQGCLANIARIAPGNGELRLVTRLPHVSGATRAAATAAVEAAPTHLLHGGVARPLTAAGISLPISRRAERFVLDAAPGLKLNGVHLDTATTLKAGDRIVAGSDEYLVIRVRD